MSATAASPTDALRLTGPGALRRVLGSEGGFAVVAELVPWAGELSDARGQQPLRMAADLAGDPRITALSVTDNAGGHARLSPDAPGEALLALGHDVIVHVACRDRNRSGMQSLGWDLLSRGLTNVLAISGDYPVGGYEGLAKPVFDIDSVTLLALLRELGSLAAATAATAATAAADGHSDPDAHAFLLGCAVDPFKRLERDLVPQLLKLGLKRRAGADYAITQVGYDAHRSEVLLRWMRREGIAMPAIGNAYVLGPGVARAFHAGRIPGVVITDALLALVERESRGTDKGRACFLELAAKQLVVLRGLGYRGIYVSGHRDAGELRQVLELADAHPAGDWRALIRDVSFGQAGAFEPFELDHDGRPTDEPSRRWVASRTPAARATARRRVDPFYKLNRVAHRRVFEPGTPRFRAWARVYGTVERAHLSKPLHVLEQAVKVPLYDCRDCGDCSLPDIAYLCPESHCQKNQRNGPCGGARDGMCEVPGHTCVWADAYRRLKPYGEELTMLDRAPVVQDNALRRTSAWANTFLERDNHAKRRAGAGAGVPAGRMEDGA
ncbi:MAG TPA: methylenetetrahydrofolate reductase C-terminal domain-containing protein [Candidatus Limnocylindrales bacterium]|nr:methylenetetrahydrofolate reductase C-terminal domain-containing protein [Candidatus Limnocylindrales bacterium]